MKRFLFVVCVLWTVLLSAGCTNEPEVTYQLSSASEEDTSQTSEPEASEEDTPQASEPEAPEAAAPKMEAAQADVSGNGDDAAGPEETIVVYICGAVKQTGVYTLAKGSRVCDAVAAAGGLLEDADEKSLNQARILSDGEQITVYTEEEVQNGLIPQTVNAGQSGMELQTGEAGQNNGGSAGSGKVNLNLADAAQLMTLPGIGRSRAEEIIRYRNENGAFSSVEEIQKVSGIKAKTFEKLKDYIEV